MKKITVFLQTLAEVASNTALLCTESATNFPENRKKAILLTFDIDE